MFASPQKIAQANKHPLNRAALKRLPARRPPTYTCWTWRGGLQAGARAVNRDGHQNDLLEQQLGLMLAWEPQNVLKWLVNNPDGPDDPEEQMATLRDLLEDAGEPEDAAASLLEWVRGPDAGGGRVGVPVPGGRVAVASRR